MTRLTPTTSLLEELFYEQVRRTLPLPERQSHIIAKRKYAFDFTWPEFMVAVEIEGGVYTSGRHVRPQGFEGDMRKYNEATYQGWRVYRFSGVMVSNGEALSFISKVLGLA